MKVTSVHNGAATKTVTVADIGPTDDDADILDVALRAARETRSSVFGWSVTTHDNQTATVKLYTD